MPLGRFHEHFAILLGSLSAYDFAHVFDYGVVFRCACALSCAAALAPARFALPGCLASARPRLPGHLAALAWGASRSAGLLTDNMVLTLMLMALLSLAFV